ncbi:hypothetical protein PPACK8108_LOCUS7818 [Phakopsora pachyrhizi]|uniref:Uncharacterized protein n=1 Tax=Phakopsora pachyrhizi TaxID=170000 RepID=A0AAV0AY38_PHAPC|nr:hypothetical protein PPACK8108_LOCUS7818 [Phakopsora pachyrhizi]
MADCPCHQGQSQTCQTRTGGETQTLAKPEVERAEPDPGQEEEMGKLEMRKELEGTAANSERGQEERVPELE